MAAGMLGLKGILPNISLTGICITDLNGMWIMGPMTQKAELVFGLGVHGQNLFINSKNRIVIAKFSSQAAPLDRHLIPMTCKWVRTLINELEDC